MGDDPVVIRPEGHEFGEQLSLGQRLFYRVHAGRGDRRHQDLLPGPGASAPSTCPTTGAFILSPIHRSNLDTPFVAPRHPAPPALHGQGVALEGQVRRLVPHRARRLPGQAGHRRPRGAAGLPDGARAGRAAGAVPRGHPPVGPDTWRCSTAPRSWPAAPGCRSCRSGSAAPRRPCPRARSSCTRCKMTIVVGEPLVPPPIGAAAPRRKAIKALTAELADRDPGAVRRGPGAGRPPQRPLGDQPADQPAADQSEVWIMRALAVISRTSGSKCSSGRVS